MAMADLRHLFLEFMTLDSVVKRTLFASIRRERVMQKFIRPISMEKQFFDQKTFLIASWIGGLLIAAAAAAAAALSLEW